MRTALLALAMISWFLAFAAAGAYYFAPRYRTELMQASIWLTVCSIGLIGWLHALPEAQR